MKSYSSPFPTTHWTLVQVVQGDSPEQAAKAMEEICRDYWFPIYAYLRRSRYNPQDAEDLTQAFFADLIENGGLQAVQQDRGKLRTFLLAVLSQLISDENRKKNALKRGGGKAPLSIDEIQAESLYALEPKDTDDPEKIYLHAWASGLLERVRQQLHTAFENEGRLELFETLQPWLGTQDKQPPYEELATTLHSTSGAVRLLVHRLRKRYRKLLEQEIAKTVLESDDVEEELAWLRKVLTE